MRRNSGIRDIVNREIVNLTNCEHEPIHIPGSIQQHGFLLGLKPVGLEPFVIDFCSENCADYVSYTHEQLLGKPFSTAFGPEKQAVLTAFLHNSGGKDDPYFVLQLNGQDFHCTFHKSVDDILVMEAEPLVAAPLNAFLIQQQTQRLLSYMQESHTLQQLCALIAQDTRNITGYDRVMIYRFDEQYNGEVFAESKRDDLESFLGLHYPHTDIPVQARQLYIKNLLRIITDVHYSPSPIFTVNDDDAKNLDLGMSTLRSSSPIHIQYLINMGVSATLTISLVHKGRLWGLIACHHYSPKNISPDTRQTAKMQGHFITSQIEIRQNNEQYESSAQSNNALQSLIAHQYPLEYSSFETIVQRQELLKLCNANGAVIFVKGIIYASGVTPSGEETLQLIRWLSTNPIGINSHTTSIQEWYPDFKTPCERVAGLVYHRLSDDEDCIIWFRQETVTQVNWAGDPNKSIIKDQNGLSPRKSFDIWQETVKCRSKKWLLYELEAAASFSLNIQKHYNAILLAEEEKKYRTLNEILNETNQELENINWISTHDLQEPLRKIQMYASRILTRSGNEMPEVLLESVEKINFSAERMRALINDILVYNKLRKSERFFEPVNLRELLDYIVEDYEDLIREKNARINIGPLPEINGISLMLRQLFVNLIHNSLKFSAPDKQPVIDIHAETDAPVLMEGKPYYKILVQDNGIGFEQKYAESIFAIFKRLHHNADFPGSGIGLSLVRKVMRTHDGLIYAEGKPGAGAQFTLLFPASTSVQ